MNARARTCTERGPETGREPADKYREALLTAAWARAEFSHPAKIRESCVNPAAPPRATRRVGGLFAVASRRDCHMAINVTVVCVALGFAALLF
jgi:hypothetical protein